LNAAHSVNGSANWDTRDPEFYIEQVGVVAAAIQEALAQDYDGLLHITPAVPPRWDIDGSVYVRGKTKVDVQARNGVVPTAVIESGMTQTLRVRNPWPGHAVDVVSGSMGVMVASGVSGPALSFQGIAGTNYHIERHDAPITGQTFAAISGVPARTAKKMGTVQIGLFGTGQ
jgi:alpha-L-fucosidase 2